MNAPLSLVIQQTFKERGRACLINLPHGVIKTPVYMPVATRAAIKGISSFDLERLNCEICLSNTYHLALQPGDSFIKNSYDKVHNFMHWSKNVLTDSGGYQMITMNSNTIVTESGVEFTSHIKGDQRRLYLTPEKSIQIQTNLGSDIMMMLDDVIRPLSKIERIKESCERTVRWLDRCIDAHTNHRKQSLFPIIQGGLDLNLRKWCTQEMIKRNLPGYAIGGLAGGESKSDFWRIVNLCCMILPKDKPIYLMGVGYPIDLVICSLLGVDMFDCVFPTRTARLGTGLTSRGFIKLQNSSMKYDFRPIDENCKCDVCLKYSRSYFYNQIQKNPRASSLISIHNIHYTFELMRSIRNSISSGDVQIFVNSFFTNQWKGHSESEILVKYGWVFEALNDLNIDTSYIRKSLSS